jgi:hypothetical protein
MSFARLRVHHVVELSRVLSAPVMGCRPVMHASFHPRALVMGRLPARLLSSEALDADGTGTSSQCKACGACSNQWKVVCGSCENVVAPPSGASPFELFGL